MTEKEPAEKPRGIKKPQDWEKAVSVAYLRAIGHTQIEAAKGAGCGVRTLREWEQSAWWKDAMAEARGRWLQGVEAFTRRGILSALTDQNEYAQMARWAAERLIPEMKPPKRRREHTTPANAPLKVNVEHGLSDEQADEVVRKVLFGLADNDDSQ
jgi:hypothetical protein